MIWGHETVAWVSSFLRKSLCCKGANTVRFQWDRLVRTFGRCFPFALCEPLGKGTSGYKDIQAG